MRIGRIYKVIALQGKEIYVGSTFNTIRDRFKEHKRKYIVFKKNKCSHYSLFDMFDKYKIDGCKIVLVKEYEVIDRGHLCVYESLWIKKLKAININLPFGEHRIQYLRSVYKKKYKDENKDKIKQQRKEYREQNKDKIKRYREENKDKIKKYREENKEKIKEQRREYRRKQKEKMNKQKE